ncbi:MAG: PAS domain S-box protein [Bacteroidetes bacterium]|nr:PAS domain S-box protein [Bacteroidota bacterium]
MEPLRVSPNRSILADYEENYYRVIFSLFGLAYLFSFYYKGPDTSPLLEFIVPRNIFAILPFLLIGLSYQIKFIKKHIKDIGSGFFLLSTLHLVGFFSINNFNTHYEIGIITLVLFSNLHLNKVLYIVLYNVIVLTALEYVFITASVTANIQPVLFFLFLLSVMLICIFYQLYRIRFNNQVNERDQLFSGIIAGNPDAWMIFEGPGLVARDASTKGMKMFGINGYAELEQISLRTIIAADSISASDEIIRNILSKTTYEIKTQCRTQEGQLFWADVSAFRIPGTNGYIQCRFLDISENRVARDSATENAIRYRSYLENIEEGIIVSDLSGEIKLANKAVIEFLQGNAPTSFSGKHLEEITGSELSKRILSAANSENQNDSYLNITIESPNSDHEKLYIQIKRTTDLIMQSAEIFIRITSQAAPKLIEPLIPSPPEKIYITEPKQETLIMNTGVPVVITDGDGIIKETNKAFELLTEYSRNELLSLKVTNLIHPEDLHYFTNQLAEIITSGKSRTI